MEDFLDGTKRNIEKLIRNAKDGSLLRRITQKIAYKIHLENKETHQDSNWYLAQDKLTSFIDDRYYEYNISRINNLLMEDIRRAFDSYQSKGERYIDIEYKFAEDLLEYNREIKMLEQILI